MAALGRAPAAAGTRRVRWRCFAAVLLLALFAWRGGLAWADSGTVERQIKAAYLYKFGSYVDWPPAAFDNPASPLIIGIIGADALADELAQMVPGRTINGRSVSVRKLRPEDSLAGLNMLFIGRDSNGRLAEVLAAARGQPLLTVTESSEALAAGSMINFVIVDAKVRFEAAPKAAGQGSLSISARLLAAAYRVLPP
jgi:hypothetical protein